MNITINNTPISVLLDAQKADQLRAELVTVGYSLLRETVGSLTQPQGARVEFNNNRLDATRVEANAPTLERLQALSERIQYALIPEGWSICFLKTTGRWHVYAFREDEWKQ